MQGLQAAAKTLRTLKHQPSSSNAPIAVSSADIRQLCAVLCFWLTLIRTSLALWGGSSMWWKLLTASQKQAALMHHALSFPHLHDLSARQRRRAHLDMRERGLVRCILNMVEAAGSAPGQVPDAALEQLHIHIADHVSPAESAKRSLMGADGSSPRQVPDPPPSTAAYVHHPSAHCRCTADAEGPSLSLCGRF
jgi:hypothetical protein